MGKICFGQHDMKKDGTMVRYSQLVIYFPNQKKKKGPSSSHPGTRAGQFLSLWWSYMWLHCFCTSYSITSLPPFFWKGFIVLSHSNSTWLTSVDQWFTHALINIVWGREHWANGCHVKLTTMGPVKQKPCGFYFIVWSIQATKRNMRIRFSSLYSSIFVWQ